MLVVSLIAGVYFSLALWPDLFRFYSRKILSSLKIVSLEKSFGKRCSFVSGIYNITRMVRLEIDILV